MSLEPLSLIYQNTVALIVVLVKALVLFLDGVLCLVLILLCRNWVISGFVVILVIMRNLVALL